MVLVIDVNNECMTAGFYGSLKEKDICTVSIEKGMTSDDFAIKLSQAAVLYKIEEAPQAAIISSVAPSLTENVMAAVQALYGIKPMVVGPGVKTGLNIKINDPSQLGSDLVAMAAGACAAYSLPALFMHVGNALTIGYIDEKYEYLGTVISAGPGKLLEAVVSGAELLTVVGLSRPGRVIGTDTAESIKSGVIYGCAAMIDGIVDRIREEKPVKTLVATGRYAELILPYCKSKAALDSTLLCDGLYNILEKQKKRI